MVSDNQGYPGGYQDQGPPVHSPGTLRDSLGSGLKSNGIFQKDGRIQNFRGGFFGSRPYGGPAGPAPYGGNNGQMPYGGPNGPMSYGSPAGSNPQVAPYYSPGGQAGGQTGFGLREDPPLINQGVSIKPRQLVLQAAQEGFPGNGIATISADNHFSVMATLPIPQTLVGRQGNAAYVAYLVDAKGKSGFPAGVLRPVGNGVYQAQFYSQVPLANYTRAVISVENPGRLGQAPSGPIVLKVKEPFGGGAAAFLTPIGKRAGSIWSKLTGMVKGRGKANPAEIEPLPAPEVVPAPLEGGNDIKG